MVSRAVNSSPPSPPLPPSPIKIVHSLRDHPPYYDDFKSPPPHLFAPASPINIAIMIKHYTQFFLPPVSLGKPYREAIHSPLSQTNSPRLHRHTNEHLLDCTFSKSLTSN